ncbi:MAG: hypothetical protein J6Z11_00460 [Candidatus Riflebacteria bacterium]|nr:hypothetical protein [Candidatus Riflebacteria bacterium]
MISILYDCFKHWSKAGSVYIYSDPHFSDAEHFKLLKANNHVPEGINTVEELDELQIKNINAFVHKNDTLICLGDVGNIELVKRLKAGYKVLLTGNHDRGAEYYRRKEEFETKRMGSDLFKDMDSEMILANGWFISDLKNSLVSRSLGDNHLFDEVYTGPLMISDKIILSHEELNPCPSYLVNLHGHTHDRPFRYDRYYNFCAEAINYTPVSLGNLIKNGLLSGIDDIHRVAVDRAIERKSKREKKTV